ncbi:NUDIX domain-containing protein [Rhizobiales bacterium RZME27]|jgi:ADP-ribose pyrophosphatase YjhB (NUDIX family)|uniref:NUDIX domain-containing protein n=1 Tax=Endobacterium cereale TaxID=2663029 RepID=A0A6A8A713_9HYPH|nr:NUDIX hydrolase [Endobacterium cereale]MEB2846222.1 NUDIX hydrolase [Endobacterium cereale]MQY45658.1 NUDIX domain-containing protein [Endobacterium cereale]
MTVSHPRPASSAILERDGRFLLIRRINPPSADLFAFPGGRGEPGETPADTAMREFFEETGIPVREPELFATYDLKTESEGGDILSHFFLSVFLVQADEDIEAVAADDAADPGWYTVDEIRALPVPPSVLECAERLAARVAKG